MSSIERALWDHPFFDYARRRGVVLTKKEAAQMIRAGGVPSFKEMIEAAKVRFADERVSWESFDAAITARRRRPAAVSWVHGHRRFAVVVLVIVLLLTFFTFTPTGRALAEKIFNVVLKVVGAQIEFVNPSALIEDRIYDDDNILVDDSDGAHMATPDETNFGRQEYDDVQAFEQQTGIAPFLLNTKFLALKAVYSYYFEPDSLICIIEYTTPDNVLVTTREQWEGKEWSVYELEKAEYKKAIVCGNKEIIYAISPIDGSFVGTILLENSVFIIAAEKSIDVVEFLSMLE